MNKKTRPKFSEYDSSKRGDDRPLLDRVEFAKLSPEEAANRLVAFNTSVVTMKQVTANEKFLVVKRILQDFAEQGLNVSTLSDEATNRYRDYFQELVDEGTYSTNTAAHAVKAWNSMIRACFGRKGVDGKDLKTGTGLLMKEFPETVRKVDVLGNDEIDRMIRAIPQVPARNETHRSALRVYLEIGRCAGPRIGSLVRGEEGEIFTFARVDWKRGVALLPHMKNSEDGHYIVLGDSAMVAIRNHAKHLQDIGLWSGPETPVMTGPGGKRVNCQYVNKKLKQLAVIAKVPKKLSTHVIRKSAGTLMGSMEDPAFAALQLGITQAIYNRHYYQPRLEDRLQKRDRLAGSDWTPQSPEEIAGKALLDLERGTIDQHQFDAQLREAKARLSLPPQKEGYLDPAYS